MLITSGDLNYSIFLLKRGPEGYELGGELLSVIALSQLALIPVSTGEDFFKLREKQCVSCTAANLNDISVLELLNQLRSLNAVLH